MLFDIAGLKHAGKDALERAGRKPRQLVTIYALVAAGAALLCSALGWILTWQMDTATGLSGLGTRATLLAVQVVVSILLAVASPMWDAGYAVSMLDVYRGKETGPRRLLWGFAHWKKLLICGFFLLIQMFVLGYLAVILAEVVYIMSPMSASLDPSALQTAMIAEDVAAMYGLMRPLVIFAVVAVLAVAAYLLFRYQLVYYVMEDCPDIPGWRLLGASALLIRGEKGQYLRLYLSYWWYFLLYIAVSAVPYLDMLLGLVGVSLPIREGWLAAGLNVLYLLLLCGLQILWKNRLFCTMAGAYTQVWEEKMTQK